METGLTYTSTVTVSEENIAATMGSGDLEVFQHDSYQAFGHGRYGFGNCRIEGSGRQKTDL